MDTRHTSHTGSYLLRNGWGGEGMNKTYKELQDELHMCHEALAEAHEREQALAAHVERLNKAALDAIHHLPGGKIKAELRDAYDSTPDTSLARRDLIKQAEELENSSLHLDSIGGNDLAEGLAYASNELLHRATELRQQAAAL